MSFLKNDALIDRSGHPLQWFGLCNQTNITPDSSQAACQAKMFRVEHCQACAFFELIPLPGGRLRKLCHLTGRKNPVAGQYDCCFIEGHWQDIDQILANYRLTQNASGHTLKVPKLTRQCSSLVQIGQKVADNFTAINAFADNSGNALHIGRVQRPQFREDAAASLGLGSVALCLFCFNNPESNEVLPC